LGSEGTFGVIVWSETGAADKRSANVVIDKKSNMKKIPEKRRGHVSGCRKLVSDFKFMGCPEIEYPVSFVIIRQI
jgi:hypothetical protein